jgi:hypothetical protein
MIFHFLGLQDANNIHIVRYACWAAFGPVWPIAKLQSFDSVGNGIIHSYTYTYTYTYTDR